MTTSGIEDSATRLLTAFYELSGGKPGAPVPFRDSGTTGGEEAAARAGLDPASTECDITARYLANRGYIRATGEDSYALTAQGVERIREMRTPEDDGDHGERSGMSDKTQKRLMTVLAIGMTVAMSQPITNYIEKAIPERRGIRDDLLEAVLQGIVRTFAFFIASIFMRRLAAWINR